MFRTFSLRIWRQKRWGRKGIGRELSPPQMLRFLYFARRQARQGKRERCVVVTKRKGPREGQRRETKLLPDLVSISRHFCRFLAIVLKAFALFLPHVFLCMQMRELKHRRF